MGKPLVVDRCCLQPAALRAAVGGRPRRARSRRAARAAGGRRVAPRVAAGAGTTDYSRSPRRRPHPFD